MFQYGGKIMHKFKVLNFNTNTCSLLIFIFSFNINTKLDFCQATSSLLQALEEQLHIMLPSTTKLWYFFMTYYIVIYLDTLDIRWQNTSWYITIKRYLSKNRKTKMPSSPAVEYYYCLWSLQIRVKFHQNLLYVEQNFMYVFVYHRQFVQRTMKIALLLMNSNIHVLPVATDSSDE